MWLGITFVIFIFFIVLLVVFFIIDSVFGKTVQRTGVIIEKSHDAESNGTGFGPSIGGAGCGMAVVFTHNEEKFTLFVKLPGGEIEEVIVSMETWIDVKKGESVTYSKKLGFFTH